MTPQERAALEALKAWAKAKRERDRMVLTRGPEWLAIEEAADALIASEKRFQIIGTDCVHWKITKDGAPYVDRIMCSPDVVGRIVAALEQYEEKK